jgi:hypothetical protein
VLQAVSVDPSLCFVLPDALVLAVFFTERVEIELCAAMCVKMPTVERILKKLLKGKQIK